MSSEIPGGDQYIKQWRALAGWFLGPRAENREELNELVLDAFNWHSDCRENFHPADPSYFTEEVKNSRACRKEMEDLKTKMHEMHNLLNTSVPFFSTRYQGHMTWDVTMPSLLGYISGLLWNQNNVDSTASPVTTQFEIEVGKNLCDMMRYERGGEYEPWGHITGCGSVANIEAMWAARNLKMHPIALQASVTDDLHPELLKGGNTPVQVPTGGEKLLKDLSQWELLNLDIDVVCKLTDDVKAQLGDDAGLLDAVLKENSVIDIGIGSFVIKHGIKKMPVVLSPGTNHYSWPKSATILGLGDQNVKPVPVDENARQNIDKLREQLQDCLTNQIPVIMVVVVIGSTEESAVDDLVAVCELRESFKVQGLDFSIHADSAWGGYLTTMIHEASSERKVKRRDDYGDDFVPAVPLSKHVKDQYLAMHRADTITIDPHKAGFCPYPAGALLYRNGTMKGFVTLEAPEVFHSPDDISVGVYGLEGSKPGAAACGVLLSHQVIGLDTLGYGRILGQCTFGAKLFYCMWMTAAKLWDDFISITFTPLPKSMPENLPQDLPAAKLFIEKRILNKTNSELYQDKEAMQFLGIVGPDALINSFTVNLKGNDDINVCNQLQDLIFNELTAKPGDPTKRVPLFLTTSILDPKNYGAAVDQLKDRLGLPSGNDDGLKFLRNTSMQPYQSSGQYVVEMGKIFRNTVLNCIGGLDGTYGDTPQYHTFVVAGGNEEGKVFLDYVPSFANRASQHQAVLTMRIVEAGITKQFRQILKKQTVFVRTASPHKLFNFLRKDIEQPRQFTVMTGSPTSKTAVLSISMVLDEVFLFNHLEDPAHADKVEYPKYQTYFMYGDNDNAYLSHIISKKPDFHQVVKLDELPHSVPYELLDLGMIVTIPVLNGEPLYLQTPEGPKFSDPLQADSYTIQYRGKQYVETKTLIKISKPESKVWFDADHLNSSSIEPHK